jgi:hypothetical protein
MPMATPGMPYFRMPSRILRSSLAKSEPAAPPLPSPGAAGGGEEVLASAGTGKPKDDAVAATATVPVAVLRNSLRDSRLGCCGDICSL